MDLSTGYLSLTKNNKAKEMTFNMTMEMTIINKDDYLQKMRNILSDSNKFSEICITKEKHLNFLINIEKQITDLLFTRA